ncbi:MAG: hypothetical protein ACLQIQ_14600 [Beijerinckiaceae bacterium]
MYSVHVSSSNDRELPPPELGPGLTWDRLTEILLREVSAEAAGILAEPIHDEARGQTHWHITARDDPKPIAALSEAESNRLMARLNERRREILRFAATIEAEGGDANMRLAAALRTVLNVPDEKQHVWSADGKPVLTAWGRHAIGRQAPQARFVKRQSTPVLQSGLDAGAAIEGTSNISRETKVAARSPTDPPPPPLGAPRPLPAALGPAVEAAAAGQPRQWQAPLLWALFVILVAISYYALLPACGLHLPIFGSLGDHCQLASSLDLASEESRNLALRDKIAAEELNIAEKRGACAVPKRAERGEHRLDAKEADQRRADGRGTHGKLDITLIWSGREDLDLHVYCPDGQIFFSHRSACGGTLEIDSNATLQEAKDAPVEHVTWQSEPPAGEYRVEVVLFDRFNLPARDIPFTVVVRDSVGQQEIAGQVQQLREPVTVTNFHR